MRNLHFTLAYGVILILVMAGLAVAQDNGAQEPSARELLQHIHTPQSIDKKLASLTKDLELTSEQQRQVRLPLQEHHDKIRGWKTRSVFDRYNIVDEKDLADAAAELDQKALERKLRHSGGTVTSKSSTKDRKWSR